MCYFTDKEYTLHLKGIIPRENLGFYANALFKNALKLQIGCGAEPTLYKDITKIIQLGKHYGIPYISLTTNGNLLTQESIRDYSNAGLNEFTISLHGVIKESYEFFMGKGNYGKFFSNLLLISDEKKKNPKLKLRINYTFNKDNFLELENFFDVFKDISIDILQLRPIQKIGNTEYQNTNLDSLKDVYLSLLEKIKVIAKEKNIILLSSGSLYPRSSSNQNYLTPYTYCYVSPNYCWREDFNYTKETFSQWSERTHWKSKIFSAILKNKKDLEKDTGTEKLNYSVDIN
jgi:MoaA/NifB/PqqE/SkfB family radical SAM enzyme